jgi:hypothetical protein
VNDEPKKPAKAACSAKIKDDTGLTLPCPGKIFDGLCSRRADHMSPFPNGSCMSGWHEGTKAKDWRGNPVRTCDTWKCCPCPCHDTYSEMFRIASMPRIVVDNSGYVKPPNPFVMPTLQDRLLAAVPASSDPEHAPRIIESELPDRIPATVARTFDPTPTGRSARGELEAYVKEQCDIWLVDADGSNLTPAKVSESIGKKYGIKEPSVGAIDAVWKRWAQIGFAEIGKKPTRFLRYTEDGIKLTLEGVKARAKKSK